MHSTIIAVLAVAGLSSAAALPYTAECPGSGAYYVCANNNFRGYCSVDPCAKTWCPDFQDHTCIRSVSKVDTTPTTISTVTISTPTATPTVIAEQPVCTDGGYYQVCSNGFKGCCKSDVCGSSKPSCPTEPVSTNVHKTTQVECSGTGAYYVCANNGFRGHCSVDPCASAWCPDFAQDTCTPTVPASAPETQTHTQTQTQTQTQNQTCPEGTGFYQVCSNGFRGCCTVDACAGTNPVCPAYV